jgi:hypothetical protein
MYGGRQGAATAGKEDTGRHLQPPGISMLDAICIGKAQGEPPAHKKGGQAARTGRQTDYYILPTTFPPWRTLHQDLPPDGDPAGRGWSYADR